MAKAKWSIGNQEAAIANHKLVNIATLSPAAITSLRNNATPILCATCLEPLEIVISETGPYGKHGPDTLPHSPEDLVARAGKKLIKSRIDDLFPLAIVEQDIVSDHPKQLVDFAIILDNGGKIAIDFLREDIRFDELNEIRSDWAREGVKYLWIGDWRKLNLGESKKQATTIPVTLGKLEVGLIKLGEPLIYLDVERRQIISVVVPSQAAALVKQDVVKTLGRIKCFVQRYRIGQLRISEGKWRLETQFDSRPPKAPPLPKRLADKLELLEN